MVINDESLDFIAMLDKGKKFREENQVKSYEKIFDEVRNQIHILRNCKRRIKNIFSFFLKMIMEIVRTKIVLSFIKQRRKISFLSFHYKLGKAAYRL